MKASPTTVCDSHPDSSRIMFYTVNGERYTLEQYRLMQFAERLEKKLDRLIDLLEAQTA